MSKIRPVPGSIAVKRDEAPKSTPGGIMLPDRAREDMKRQTRTGTIIAVGGNKTNDRGVVEELGLHVGQRIVFGAFAGSEVEIELDGKPETICVMVRDQVMGVIEE